MSNLAAPGMARWLRCLGAVMILALLAGGSAAQDLQPVPPLTAHVMDRTGTLTAPQLAALEARLVALEAAKGSQVVVLMLATTQPEDVASFANRVGNAWKIGRKGVGDGLLLLVLKDDRKVRIEVSKTLEGAIPDLLAKRIISEAITPRFKQGDYAGGIEAGVERISAAIKGEALPEVASVTASASRGGDVDWMSLAVFMFFLVPVGGALARSLFGRGLGALVTGGGLAALMFFLTASLWLAVLLGLVALLFTLLSGAALPMGRGGTGSWGGGFGAGGGGFSGGGGGFSSGGGGDFGGGGASGDW